MATLLVTINGQQVRLLADSFNLEDGVGERSVCEFTVIDRGGLLNLRRGAPVLVWDEEGFRVFGGVVEIPQRSRAAYGHYLWKVICADWHYLADKRVVRASYVNMTAGAIVRDLVNQVLSSEGVIVDFDESDTSFVQGDFPAEYGESIVQTVYDGPVVAEAVFNYVSFSKAMDGLAELAGFWWMIDQFRRLWFMPHTANRVNITLTAADAETGSIAVEDTNSQYRNRQYIRGGKDITDTQVVERLGDGVTTAFVMDYPLATVPTVEVRLNESSYLSTYLALASSGTPPLVIYKREGDTLTKLPNPATLPGSSALFTAFSGDGNYLAVASQYTPNLTIYKRTGDTFVKLPDPSSMPGGTCYGVAFSPSGNYLAVAHSSSPYITIYRQSGDSFFKMANPETLPPNTAYAVAWSADSTYLAVGHYTSPNMTIYKDIGGTFAKVANPTSLPNGSVQGLAFSPDGSYLATVFNYSPYMAVYKRDGDVFTRLPNPDVLPAMSYGVAFSPDGLHLAIAQANNPGLIIYKRNGDAFSKLPGPDTPPAGTGYSVVFSPDGAYLAVASAGSPYVAVYGRDGDTFTKLDDPVEYPTNSGRGVAFSFDRNSDFTWQIQTVGIRGVEDGKQWYWNKGDKVVSQDNSAEPLQGTDVLRVTYRGEYDMVAISQDTAEILRLKEEQGTSGLVEDVSDEPTVSTRESAFQIANAKLAKYGRVSRRVRFRTRRWGLDPGKLIDVHLPEHGLDHVEMMIESCNVTVMGQWTIYHVTCIEGASEGSWTRYFTALQEQTRLSVIRQNISEQEVLIIPEQFVDTPAQWSEQVTQTAYACTFPSPTLYPSPTLIPC